MTAAQAAWCLLAVALAGAGAAACDRWPNSRLAWWARVVGCSWLLGVVLGLFLLS